MTWSGDWQTAFADVRPVLRLRDKGVVDYQEPLHPAPPVTAGIAFSSLREASACKVHSSSIPWRYSRTSERFHRLEVCRRACFLPALDRSDAPSCIAPVGRTANRGSRFPGHGPSRTPVGAHTPRGPQDSYRRFHDLHGESCRGRLWGVLASCGSCSCTSFGLIVCAEIIRSQLVYIMKAPSAYLETA